MNATRPNELGKCLVRFFGDYLPIMRGMSQHSIRGYRDAIVLFLRFVAKHTDQPIENLDLKDFNAKYVREFLAFLEKNRHNSIATRNTRLAAWQEPSTTARGVRDEQFVEVTHPFHPLFGRRFELLTVRQTWGEYRVFFYDEQGALKALPASWTDAGTTPPFIILSAGRAHFRPTDLLALVSLLGDLRDRNRTDEGDECVK